MRFWGKGAPALLAVAVTLLCLRLWPDSLAGFFGWPHLAAKVLKPMARSLFFMALGLVMAMTIESLGWTVRLGRLASPLARRARLPRVAAASFTTALVSNPAANGLLSEALDKGELSPRALMVANLLNGSWPAFIVHLPSTAVVAVSFAGRAGLAYTGIMFTAATLRLMGAAALGRLILPPVSYGEAPAAGTRKTWREIWPGLKKRLARRLATLMGVAAPVYYLITLVSACGFFEALKTAFAGAQAAFFLPVEAAALVAFSVMAEFSSGFAAAGALMENSALTFAQAAAALVLGNILATPLRVLRWQLAAFMGFFKPRLGLALIFCNQGFRVASLAAALFIFWRICGD